MDSETVDSETDQLSGPSADSAEIGNTQVSEAYGGSLIEKFSRLALLLVAFPLLVWFIWLALKQHSSTLSFVALVMLLASLLFTKGIAWLRAFILVAMTLNVFATFINPESLTSQNDSPLRIPNAILLGCLAVATLFEIASVIRSSSRRTIFKSLGWSCLAIPAVVYAIGIPLLSSLWESTTADPSKLSPGDPEWTMIREVGFRSAKFAVFAAFTYLGACIGSFLNVVAWSVPRGKSVGMRDSSCPKCNEKIKRIDNLPIFSYINLSAKCRNCKASIPVRYLIVEIVVATIFGSLFLYELVTGAANVPSAQPYTHTGILWTILYPKWDVISLFFYHASFMSLLLVLSLIEWDRQKLTWRFPALVLVAFLLPATIYFPLQPIDNFGVLPSFLGKFQVSEQLLKLVAGGLVGAVIGTCYTLLFSRGTGSTLIPAMILVGIVLGWQSVVHVSVLFALGNLLANFLPGLRTFLGGQPTAILLMAVMIHHPLWEFVFENLKL